MTFSRVSTSNGTTSWVPLTWVVPTLNTAVSSGGSAIGSHAGHGARSTWPGQKVMSGGKIRKSPGTVIDEVVVRIGSARCRIPDQVAGSTGGHEFEGHDEDFTAAAGVGPRSVHGQVAVGAGIDGTGIIDVRDPAWRRDIDADRGRDIGHAVAVVLDRHLGEGGVLARTDQERHGDLIRLARDRTWRADLEGRLVIGWRRSGSCTRRPARHRHRDRTSGPDGCAYPPHR